MIANAKFKVGINLNNERSVKGQVDIDNDLVLKVNLYTEHNSWKQEVNLYREFSLEAAKFKYMTVDFKVSVNLCNGRSLKSDR